MHAKCVNAIFCYASKTPYSIHIVRKNDKLALFAIILIYKTIFVSLSHRRNTTVSSLKTKNPFTPECNVLVDRGVCGVVYCFRC